MNKPDLTALWEAYTHALERFNRAPASCRAEAAVIATYAAWVRAYCPRDADNLISDLCKNIAAFTPARRVA